MFKSKTFIGLSIALSVIFSSCEFFNTSVPDWFREYTDYPSVSDSSWAGKGKKDSSGVINAASSEDFTVTIRLNNAQQFKFTAGENMTLTLPQQLKDAGLNTGAVSIKQDESDLSKIIITYPAYFLQSAENTSGGSKFDISPKVTFKHPKIGIDICTYNSLKVICNSAPAMPSGAVLYKDSSDSKYVICFNMPDKNAMKTGAQDSDIKSIQINGNDYPITLNADGTFSFSNPNFLQTAPSNYEKIDSHEFIPNGQPVYFKTDDAVGSHPVYKIEVFDKTIGSGAVTVSADMLRLKNPSVQQKDSFGTFTNLASGENNNIPVSDDGSTASVYITPPSEYEGDSPVQDVSVIYELWRGHDTASDRILSGTVEAAHTVVSVPGGKTLLRVYAHKDGAMDSAVTEYKISVAAYVYYVKGEGASELSGTAVDTNEGTKFYPFATVKAAIQRINDEGSSTTPYTVYIDGSAQETAAISVGGNGGGSTARKVQIKRYGSGTAGFGRKDEHTPSGTLLAVEKDSELTLNGITVDGKNIALTADEIVSRGNTVFEGCTVQNYTAETKRVLYVENGNCTISNTVMQGAASLTPQGYVYVNKTAAESPVFTVKGSVKIGGAGDLTSVILGCYEDSPHNWNSAFVKADGLNAGSYINLVPSKYDKQSGKTLVKGSGASSYKDYFHIVGNSDDGGHYLLEAGDDGGINNALILKKSIIISGGDENAWAKLKYNAERANDGEVIVVTGTIKASNSTATINSTSVNNFGDIVITKKVTIRAKDETGAIIDANKKDGGKTAHRIFKADGTGAELTLQNIKLQGGIAEGGHEIAFGGAVYVKGGGTLVLNKCVIFDNSAWRGGGIYIAEDSKFEAKNGCKILQNKAVYDTSMPYSGLGGGVSTSKSGEIELSNAELNDNTAEQSGGAICIYGAKSFKIENCTIKQNKAKHYGAGVFCDDNYEQITAEITDSAIENNELDQNLEQDSSGTYGGAGISFTGIGADRTLTISGGSIKNNKAYKLYGGGIRAGIATVTIKDNVNISGNTAEKGGGVYSIISGTFNMESGTISGNKAVTGGGVFLSGTFNMSGGIISGNEAKKSDTEYGDGGGVYIDGTSGQLNMKDGSLIQPSADKLAGKNDVYIGENKFIQLTGALTNSSNVVANLTSGSYDSDKTLVKWSGAGDMEGYKARFALTENGGTWSLILSTDKKSLILKPKNETKLIDGSKGGTWAQLKTAVEGAEANAEILVKGTIKASSSDSEIEVSKPVTIKPKGANAVLDADNHCRIFKITGSGKLTLQKDSSNKITLTNGNADKGGAVYVENAGEFTAYDLNISGCKAGGSGGAIFTENSTTVTVINGKLSSCTAGGNGGAIVNGGALNISSITFESNEAKGGNSHGGAIYSDGTSSVTASGCTFGGTEDAKGNKAQNGGAAAIVGNSENAVVFTSCIFQKNTAEGSHGGAIFAERAITVKGTSSNKTKILSNKIGGASGKGGGIYSSAKLYIEYAEISGNTVTGGSGGGIYSTGILNIINSTIGGTGADSGNTANGTDSNGGGIYAGEKSVCTIKDSDIVGNTANGMGGGLFVSSDGTEKGKCTITGGTFKKNEAKGSGGGGIYTGGELSIESCTIGGTGDGNTASGVDGGGGIFIYNGSCTLTSTIVTGNAVSGTTAKGAGVFLYSSYNNPIFTVGGTTKIGSVTDTNAVYVGYALSFQAVVTADNLKDGAYINLEPANYPNQKNRELVKGANTSSYASSYKDYFHLTGITTGETWRLQPNSDDNALVLQEIIDGGDGSSSGAWKKLKEAVTRARENDVILVKGTIKATNDTDNSGEILVNNKKITIKKEGTADVVIDANTKSRIFKISGVAELTLDGVELKNGKVTGNGGGILVDNSGKLTMINGSKITSCEATGSSGGRGGAICLSGASPVVRITGGELSGNTAVTGGAVDVSGGKLYINTNDDGTPDGEQTTQIKNNTIKTASSSDTLFGGAVRSSSGTNLYIYNAVIKECKAIAAASAIKAKGAGLYIEGNATLIKTEISGCKFGTESSGTFSETNGGGIYVDKKGICNINEGVVIKENKCTVANMCGGGIYISGDSGDSGTVNIKGESAENPVLIQSNDADNGGGIFTQGTLAIKFTKLSGHTNSDNGGGIYVSAGSVTAEDCTFADNEALSVGGAVYVNDGTFKIKGSTTFTVDNGKNDVYLKTGKTISLDDALSGTAPIARITPESYTVGHQVLTGDTQSGTPKNYTKFKVTPEGINKEWEIDSDGKLAKKRKTIKNSDTNAWEQLKNAVSAAADGDVIIIDGEIKASKQNNNFGEIKITKKLTIRGKNEVSSDILNANTSQTKKEHRIFSVEGVGQLTLEGLTLKDGTPNGDGGLIYCSATVIITGCSLSSGSAYNGGGIAISASGGTCTLENTTITGCTANTAAHGGAVAVLGPSEGPNPKCKFIMKNGTNINNEIGKNKNDVYLVSAAFIKLENFTNGTARITPLTYAEGHKVLEGATAENYKKFTVTPNGSVNWYVGSNGNLTQTQP